MHPLAPLPKVFVEKKARILSQLAVPMALYGDLSPKGSIDDGIRDLIDGINARDGLVTTSSCAGRVVVFAEGAKRGEVMVTMETEKERHGDVDEGEDEGKGDVDGCQVEVEKTQALKGGKMNLARAGGKGGGGKWLFVSHEPVDMEDSKRDGVSSFLGMPRMEGVVEHGRPFTEERLIHFKFEPMILHVLTASLFHAQAILSAALQAGFRESGALNLISVTSEAPTPMVAVRSTGLTLDSIVGRLDADGEGICLVPESYLEGLLDVVNNRFIENSRRINRFRDLMLGSDKDPFDIEARKKSRGDNWEDASERRERKKAEGLKRSMELRQQVKGEDI